jgi:hypothetical protein
MMELSGRRRWRMRVGLLEFRSGPASVRKPMLQALGRVFS